MRKGGAAPAEKCGATAAKVMCARFISAALRSTECLIADLPFILPTSARERLDSGCRGRGRVGDHKAGGSCSGCGCQVEPCKGNERLSVKAMLYFHSRDRKRGRSLRPLGSFYEAQPRGAEGAPLQYIPAIRHRHHCNRSSQLPSPICVTYSDERYESKQ